MISELVAAKPDDLRAFLEEAAGISRYKERRRETERRMKVTRENLDRLEDIRAELATRLGRLQRQAKAAARYRDLRAEQRLRTAELTLLRLRAVEAELARDRSRHRRVRDGTIRSSRAPRAGWTRRWTGPGPSTRNAPTR